jgi:glycosyltransferase involved in cell wall biosynthesis
METRKILMTTSFYPPYHVGGDATHVKYLAEGLVKKGHEVHILHSIDAYNLKNRNKTGRKTFHNDNESKENDVMLHTLKSPIGRFEPVFNYIFGAQRHTLKTFKTLVKEHKFDVVHHHNISLLGYNLLKKIDSYQNLYTAHGYWLVCPIDCLFKSNQMICENNGGGKKSYYRCSYCALKWKRPPQLWRYGNGKFKEHIKDIDLVIAPSHFMKKKLLEKFADLSIEVIPNFVPQAPLHIENFSSSYKAYKDYFLYAGVLDKDKGVLELLNVVFKDEEVKSKLIVVGTGPLESSIKNFISRNKLEDKVIYLGWANKGLLYSLYKGALALILPSLWFENSPLSVLECLSVGTPVIGSNMGGIPEILEKVDSKLIFNADDFNMLKDIVIEFDKEKYQDKKKIIRIYQENFSEEVYLKKYLSLLR